MGKDIEVSVVMSVYNGAQSLRRTLDSVLSQEGVDFEFIIVNDGSTDESPDILDAYNENFSNLKIFHQDNMGLTKALINGCASARGKYIARQDAGDISLPGRLRTQIDLFERNADAVLVSCGTRFFGPEGEHLYDVLQNPKEATEGLGTSNHSALRGPSHHGSTIFRRSVYEAVGGYRSEFYFAQDLDLWMRLSEIGTHITIPEVLYEARVIPSDISRRCRKEQIKLTKYLLECKRLRLAGFSEDHILSKAANIHSNPNQKLSRHRQAKAFYFIGACLKKKDHIQARKYFKEAIRSNPLYFRSWFRLLFGQHS